MNGQKGYLLAREIIGGLNHDLVDLRQWQN